MNYQAYLNSEHWQKVREEAINRAAGHCAVCDSLIDVNVHHKNYDNLGCERAKDIVVLCAVCHSVFHKAKRIDDADILENPTTDPDHLRKLIRYSNFTVSRIIRTDNRDILEDDPPDFYEFNYEESDETGRLTLYHRLTEDGYSEIDYCSVVFMLLMRIDEAIAINEDEKKNLDHIKAFVTRANEYINTTSGKAREVLIENRRRIVGANSDGDPLVTMVENQILKKRAVPDSDI